MAIDRVDLPRATELHSVPSDVPRDAVPFLRLVRPRQWVKNVLVFAAPMAAGTLSDLVALRHALVAFLAFSMAASGTYCLNDAMDAESDRAHPRKRFRPVASGQVSPNAARVGGVALLVGSLAAGTLLDGWRLAVVVGAYVVLTTTYTWWLKHIAVIEVAAVAAGFVLRAIGGAVATGVHLSDWFLIVACSGSILMVAGKRTAELAADGASGAHRAVLAEYPPSFLVHLRTLASAATILAYALFAFDRAAQSASLVPWSKLSIAPFTLAVLRYVLRVEQGAGGAPEDVVLEDRPFQVLVLVWLVIFALGVYLQ